jgi:tRNA pseudouridine38-40 synthase
MNKYKITVEYDGTSFSGWQTQKNARSIQGTLIEAACSLFGQDVDVQGAGRTDAGVHAIAQVAHLETSKKMSPQKILYGINDRLPASINVLKVEEASPRFHARHHAKARSYIYRISRQRTAFGKKYIWWVKDDLDVKKMRSAAQTFQGFHDFVSFADKRFDKEASTKVMLDAVELVEHNDLIIVRITGSHFLWKMVRRMVGILVEVGRGNATRRDVENMLFKQSDLPAKNTAPPSGLFLAQVLYEGDLIKPLLPPLSLLPNLHI